MTKPPREWTIRVARFEISENHFELVQIADGTAIDVNDFVPAIEMAAYTALERKLQIAIQALKFYTNTDIWVASEALKQIAGGENE